MAYDLDFKPKFEGLMSEINDAQEYKLSAQDNIHSIVISYPTYKTLFDNVSFGSYEAAFAFLKGWKAARTHIRTTPQQ